MTDDTELTGAERAALDRWRVDAAAPPHIAQAVVDALKQRGLIASRRPRWAAATLAAAALLAAFVAGSFMPRSDRLSSREPQFVLLLYSGDDAASAPSRREEYTAWARTIAGRGTAISGLELVDSPDAVLSLPSDTTLPAAMPAQPRGFFVVRARDFAEARRIAETCPHLRHGGRIVLRRVAS